MTQLAHIQSLHAEPASPIHVISLGAGVQSSTMALMAAAGEITPMPKFAVFADTGDEPQEVYDWLTKLSKLLPFPVHVRTRSRLSEHLFEWGHSQIPCFIRGNNGRPTIGKRQCTKHWKVIPVQQGIRSATATQRKRLPPSSVILWQGISFDEMERMARSRAEWIEHRWPLVEMRVTRRHCERWLSDHDLSAPKSACCYCPLKRRAQWQQMKDRGGSDWALCVSVSRQLQARGEFLTQDLKPIDEIDFSRPLDDHPEFSFRDECEGMCGV